MACVSRDTRPRQRSERYRTQPVRQHSGDGCTRRFEALAEGRLLATMGVEPGIYDVQSHVAVGKRGNIYFAQAQRNLIRKFSPQGNLLVRWR